MKKNAGKKKNRESKFGHLTVPDKRNYKTDAGWLRAVYRKNKDFIDARAGDFQTFKYAVLAYVEAGDTKTVRGALKLLSRTSGPKTAPEYGFMGRNEMQQQLFERGMHGQKKAFKQLVGEKFDASKIHYNSKTKQWDYIKDDGTTAASFTLSRGGISPQLKRGRARYIIK